MERRRFSKISITAFQSDADRRTLEALRRVPLFPQALRKFHDVGFDRWLFCMNMASSVRCGRNQYPTLIRILEEACEILDMPVPELYVTGNPFPNAWTGGVERPYITLRSSIIDTLDDDGLLHLMGHELGHIKCGHVLYFEMARFLIPLLEHLGRRTMGLGDAAAIALMLAFFEWARQAEVTCDRAGLLCSQSFEVSAQANLSLTAGPNRLSHEQSVDAFLEQSRVYQDMDLSDALGKALVWLQMGATSAHPMPVHRTQELDRWVQGGGFQRVMDGLYDREPVSA
jgi:Zn-dependent protease with chaperone function